MDTIVGGEPAVLKTGSPDAYESTAKGHRYRAVAKHNWTIREYATELHLRLSPHLDPSYVEKLIAEWEGLSRAGEAP